METIRALVAEWMRRAHADLAVAEMIDNEHIAPEILAFHAQQAAEKALKALLVQRQVEFPPTHSIGVLIALCRDAGYIGGKLLIEAATLTRYAVSTRYPGVEENLVDRKEASEAAMLAVQVVAWIEKWIEETDVDDLADP
jgi:HEPN domain-containing protein